MSIQFTETGLQIDTYQSIFDKIVADYRAIYGNDIDLSENTPDGQRVGILAKLVLDNQSFAQSLYSNLDIDFSSGTFQDVMLKIVGLSKKPATRSQVDLTVVSDRVTTLPLNYTVKDSLGQEWITTTTANLVVGNNTVTFYAKEWGNVTANANTITLPQTVVLGVTSVNNSNNATAGVDEETEQAVRIRRNNALSNPSYSTLGALVSKIGALTGVTDVAVYENNTSTTDSNGIPAHSIWAVVENGVIADIVETITKQKTAGAGTHGNISGTYVETITRNDNTTFTINHTQNFSRPTLITLYVRVNAKRIDTAVALDLDLIKNEIAKKTFKISEDLNATSLYSFGYNAGNNFILYDLQISNDNSNFTNEILHAGLGDKFSLINTNITVTEITS